MQLTIRPTAPAVTRVVIILPVERLLAANEPGATLAAIDMLVATRGAAHQWQVVVRERLLTDQPGGTVETLLGACTSLLPDDGLLVGWRLADDALPLLFEAAGEAASLTGRAFLEQLAKLVKAGSDDLAVARGGSGAPSILQATKVLGEEVAPIDPSIIRRALAGDREPLVAGLHDRLRVLWRLWLVDRARAALPTIQGG